MGSEISPRYQASFGPQTVPLKGFTETSPPIHPPNLPPCGWITGVLHYRRTSGGSRTFEVPEQNPGLQSSVPLNASRRACLDSCVFMCCEAIYFGVYVCMCTHVPGMCMLGCECGGHLLYMQMDAVLGCGLVAHRYIHACMCVHTLTRMHTHKLAHTCSHPPLTHILPITHTLICPFKHRLLCTPFTHFFF